MKRMFAAFLIVWSFSVQADTVTDVSPLAGGTYVMKINGTPHVAVTKARLDAMAMAQEENSVLMEKLAKTEQDLREYRSLTTSYEQLRKDYVVLTDKFKLLTDDSLKLGERYSEAGSKLITLAKDYGGLVKDYDVLAQKYRDIALRSDPRQPFDLGMGVVHSADTDHVVALAGMGTGIFDVGLRGWVFGGQDTYGVMIGVSF